MPDLFPAYHWTVSGILTWPLWEASSKSPMADTLARRPSMLVRGQLCGVGQHMSTLATMRRAACSSTHLRRDSTRAASMVENWLESWSLHPANNQFFIRSQQNKSTVFLILVVDSAVIKQSEHISSMTLISTPCRLPDCKNRSTLFPGRMS